MNSAEMDHFPEGWTRREAEQTPPIIPDASAQAAPPRRSAGSVAQKCAKALGNREGKFSCPKCGSQDTDCRKEMLAPVVAAGIACFMLAFLLVPVLPYKCACRTCGNRWRP